VFDFAHAVAKNGLSTKFVKTLVLFTAFNQVGYVKHEDIVAHHDLNVVLTNELSETDEQFGFRFVARHAASVHVNVFAERQQMSVQTLHSVAEND
jgi:hypothetical protein